MLNLKAWRGRMMSSSFTAVFPNNWPYPISKTVRREYWKFNVESLLPPYLILGYWKWLIRNLSWEDLREQGLLPHLMQIVTDPNSCFWTVETVKLQALLQVNHHSILKSQQIWDLLWKRISCFFFKTGNLKLPNQACQWYLIIQAL